MHTLRAVLDTPAFQVFLGTVPLLGAIIWGLLQNERSLRAIDKRIDGLDKRMDNMDKRMDGIDQRLGRMESRIDSIDSILVVMSERLVKVATKLEGGQLVLAPR
jgi:DNA anti-recombination protein RmuC